MITQGTLIVFKTAKISPPPPPPPSLNDHPKQMWQILSSCFCDAYMYNIFDLSTIESQSIPSTVTSLFAIH